MLVLCIFSLSLSLSLIYFNVLVGHVGERFSEVLKKDTEKTSSGNQDQSLFVDNVDLLGDQESRHTSGSSNITSLGNERVTGKRIEETVGLLLGFLYKVLNNGFLIWACSFFFFYWVVSIYTFSLGGESTNTIKFVLVSYLYIVCLE